MKSRVHPKYKTKYRVANWAAYDKALVKRGDISLWLSEDAIRTWMPAHSGRHGAPRKYSGLAIETKLTLWLAYGLQLRRAEGFLRSLLRIMKLSLDAPDRTTFSRRSRQLSLHLKRTAAARSIDMIVDSTGSQSSGKANGRLQSTVREVSVVGGSCSSGSMGLVRSLRRS